MASINDLPDEVLEFILSQLPPYKDLEQCALVSKRWNSVVKSVIRHSVLSLFRGLGDFRLCWKSLPEPTLLHASRKIAGRFSHSAVVHKNSMYVFGGGSSRDTTFNDLWRFDLSRRQWIRPLSMGSYPSPKASATMLCHDDNLVLFGGLRYPSLFPPFQQWRLFDEVHLYKISKNHWTVHTALSGPPPMAGHSATIHNGRMIVFGGYQIIEEITSSSNDVWCLDLKNFKWNKPEIGNIKPNPRYGQFQVALDENNLLILGGCGGPNNIFSDAWLLCMANDDKWQWRSVTIKNKKWAATHMWCNPACVGVGKKLVVLGPTPNLPSDFQILKQQMPQAVNPVRRDQLPREADQHPRPWQRGLNDDEARHRRIEGSLNVIRDMQVEREANLEGNQPNLRPPNIVGRALVPPQIPIPGNAPQASNQRGDDAASRLQRNLARRYREDDANLPKRFDEPFEDRFRMAAFNPPDNAQNATREQRQQERIRRMEEKMHALRNVRRNFAEQKTEEPSPKRTKTNCLAMFVCDFSNVLTTVDDPYIEWMEYKNYGIVSGAPERLILSTMVAGNGEFIMFGGVHKESLADMMPQVSNSVHLLTAPRAII